MRRAWLGLTIVFVAAFATLGMAQVSIVSPRDGETVRSRWLTLKVEKPTPEGYVMIWFDGKFVTAITQPFEFRIDLGDRKIFSGTHTIKVAGFNRLGQKEGEAQVQFQVNLVGAEAESTRLVFKPRTGELTFYTLQANSETTVEVPAKAIRQKVPQLSTKLIIRWFQTVRDVTPDRQYRMMRVVEDGVLEREVPITTGGGLAMGAPMGGMGARGMLGGEMGEMGFGMPGQMGMMGAPGAPTTPGVSSLTTTFTRLRLRPTDNQKVSLFVLFPNGNIVTGEEMPNVVKFATGSVDIVVPERELKVGERWIGFVTLPKNLENLTIIGAATAGMGMGGMPMMGGMPGEEVSGMPGMMGGPMGGPMMPGGLMRPGGPAMGMPGRPGMPGAPAVPGMPMQPGAPTLPGMPGATQEPEAFLADAPVVTIPATHRFDGFEFWNDQLCARIVSEFKGVTVELDLAPTTGMGQMGPGGAPGMPGGPMMSGVPGMGGLPGAPGMPGMMGGQMMPGAPGIGGMPGSPAGPAGQIPQTKLTGKAEGSRTLLFDIENGRVVYVKVTLKATFDTDLLTVFPFVQSQLVPPQQLAGMPGAPGSPTMPGGAGFGPGGMWGGQPIGGFGMPGGIGFGPGGMWGGPMGGFGMPGGEFGMPGGEGGFYGGYGGGFLGGLGGGAPTTPAIFGRLGTGTFGPTMPGGFGMPGAPGMPGMPQQPTFRNHPAKLIYSVNLENALTHSGRLDQQLKILGAAK